MPGVRARFMRLWLALETNQRHNLLLQSEIMQTPNFRRFFQCAAFAAAIAIVGAATPSVAAAQATAGDQATTTRTTDDDHDGFDAGWLGLLGLAGLFGLRRRDNNVHHTDTTTRR